MNELEDVVEFRNRLVAYMNLVRDNVTRYGPPPSDSVQARLSAEQPWLAQEYGRQYKVINRWGGLQMTMPALGITSWDVIQDAIHDIGDVYYGDICRFAVQHLDTAIGRLRGEAEQKTGRSVEPDTLYRLTSPVYWIQRFGAFLRWLFGTARGRVVAIMSALVIAIVGGLASGAGQAFVERLLSGSPPVP
jgi:hypothetical protein